MAADVRGTTLLVRPAAAEAQLAIDEAAGSGTAGGEGGPGDGTGRVPAVGDKGAGDQGRRTKAARRFYGIVAADPDRLGRDAGRVAQEIVAHLHGLVGTETEVTIEIRATNPAGFPEAVVKIVSENASALRFKDHGFESS